MNEKLLSVITAIKHKKLLAITESYFDVDGKEDWLKQLHDYYFNELPAWLITDLGLKRNETCFRALESFKIPNEWNETESDKLNQFTFFY